MKKLKKKNKISWIELLILILIILFIVLFSKKLIDEPFKDDLIAEPKVINT